MKIDDSVLNKLEKLASIHIDENKRDSIKKELSDILGFVENISSVDVKEHCFDTQAKTPLREDTPANANISSHVLSHAPNAMDNFFIVPKIIE